LCARGADILSAEIGELGDIVKAFKAARLFCPKEIIKKQPAADAVDSLKAFPILQKQKILDGLKVELSQYLAKASDMSSKIDPSSVVDTVLTCPSGRLQLVK
jgi:hypothetical protein